MNSQNSTKILLIASIGVFLFVAGFKLGEMQKSVKASESSSPFNQSIWPKSSRNNVDMTLFWNTWEELQSKYVDKSKIDPKKMMYGAIRGMVASTEDPYTAFMTPDENKEFKQGFAGKFEGIGAQLETRENRIVIASPLKGSPAEKAGIRAGDFVNKVDGQSTKGWTLVQAVSKIRGHKGTQVKLTIERDKKERDITITRDEIKVPSVELSYEQSKDCKSNCPKVAYLRINQFIDDTNKEWTESVNDIVQKWNRNEIKGMVLDLRDNPGGYLESSVYTASEFLTTRDIVVKQESTTVPSQEYYAERNGKLQNIPLVILINKGSASASEIVAGSLRDHDKAQLVGEKSFGKGSVQDVVELREGAALRVTVAKWILPDGDWINSKGIEPQIKVENKIKEGETLTMETDAQLQRAILEVLK